MVHIETVDLSARNITLPCDRVEMVIAQPYVPDSSLTSAEPYQCTEEAKPEQLAVLTETLTVARSNRHGASKTHFTIFPEYCIPGLDGISLVETALRAPDWPNGTVVIGGTDGLTQAQYSNLINAEATHVDAARNINVGTDEWVNCGITWVKGGDGRVERWIQPKLHPAREEMDICCQRMFCGRGVYLFSGQLENGAPFRFGTLICFDWIATVGQQKTCQWILGDLQRQANGNQLPLSWLFIIQRNKKPSHDTFLGEVGAFFNETEFPNALRDRACLVFANTAGKAKPGWTDQFGGSSVVLSHRSGFLTPTCVPTFSSGGPRFRDGSKLLSYYEDAFFRERGACIHSFAQVNPGSLVAGPVGRSFAVEHASVFPISGNPEPRAPGASVPACIKWMNDELDSVSSLSARYRTAPLAAQADRAHQRIISELRVLSPQFTTHAVKLAAQESKCDDADDWADVETEALEHLVHTLDIIEIGFPSPVLDAYPAHAIVRINDRPVDLIAIRGASHEDCIEHSKRFLSNPRRQWLLVSRDPDNTPWLQRFGSYLDPEPAQLGQERNITDEASGSLQIGYEKLLGIFRQSTTVTGIEGGINAALAA